MDDIILTGKVNLVTDDAKRHITDLGKKVDGFFRNLDRYSSRDMIDVNSLQEAVQAFDDLQAKCRELSSQQDVTSQSMASAIHESIEQYKEEYSELTALYKSQNGTPIGISGFENVIKQIRAGAIPAFIDLSGVLKQSLSDIDRYKDELRSLSEVRDFEGLLSQYDMDKYPKGGVLDIDELQSRIFYLEQIKSAMEMINDLVPKTYSPFEIRNFQQQIDTAREYLDIMEEMNFKTTEYAAVRQKLQQSVTEEEDYSAYEHRESIQQSKDAMHDIESQMQEMIASKSNVRDALWQAVDLGILTNAEQSKYSDVLDNQIQEYKQHMLQMQQLHDETWESSNSKMNDTQFQGLIDAIQEVRRVLEPISNLCKNEQNALQEMAENGSSSFHTLSETINEVYNNLVRMETAVNALSQKDFNVVQQTVYNTKASTAMQSSAMFDAQKEKAQALFEVVKQLINLQDQINHQNPEMFRELTRFYSQKEKLNEYLSSFYEFDQSKQDKLVGNISGAQTVSELKRVIGQLTRYKDLYMEFVEYINSKKPNTIDTSFLAGLNEIDTKIASISSGVIDPKDVNKKTNEIQSSLDQMFHIDTSQFDELKNIFNDLKLSIDNIVTAFEPLNTALTTEGTFLNQMAQQGIISFEALGKVIEHVGSLVSSVSNQTGSEVIKTQPHKVADIQDSSNIARENQSIIESINQEAQAVDHLGTSLQNMSENLKSAFSFNPSDDIETIRTNFENFASEIATSNGLSLSKVRVNTNKAGEALGADVVYYNDQLKESLQYHYRISAAISQTGEVQKEFQFVSQDTVKNYKAIADAAERAAQAEIKATEKAIKNQDTYISQKNKNISTLSAALDPNANRTLIGTAFETEARNKIQAIIDEVAKLDAVLTDGSRKIFSDVELNEEKRIIESLIREAGDYIRQSKNSAYAPIAFDSKTVESNIGTKKNELALFINNLRQAGVLTGELEQDTKRLAEELEKVKTNGDLKQYLSHLQEVESKSRLAIQQKKEENAMWEEYNRGYTQRDIESQTEQSWAEYHKRNAEAAREEAQSLKELEQARKEADAYYRQLEKEENAIEQQRRAQTASERDLSGKYWNSAFQESIKNLTSNETLRPELQQLKAYILSQSDVKQAEQEFNQRIRLQSEYYKDRIAFEKAEPGSSQEEQALNNLIKSEKAYNDAKQSTTLTQERQNKLVMQAAEYQKTLDMNAATRRDKQSQLDFKNIQSQYKEYLSLQTDLHKMDISDKDWGVSIGLIQSEIQKYEQMLLKLGIDVNQIDQTNVLTQEQINTLLEMRAKFISNINRLSAKNNDQEQQRLQTEQEKNDRQNKNYGKSIYNSAEKKYNRITNTWDTSLMTDPKAANYYQQYLDAFSQLQVLRNQFANDPDLARDPIQVDAYNRAVVVCDQLYGKVSAIVKENERLQEILENLPTDALLKVGQVTNMSNVKTEIEAFAQTVQNGTVAIDKFSADGKTAFGTFTDGAGNVEQVTIAVKEGTNEIYMFKTGVQQAADQFRLFKPGTIRQFFRAFTGGSVVYKFVSAIRQGITSVKNLDLAMTELRKVTDETEQTYDRFVKTASQSAGKIGSTVTDYVNATADFARLGYSLSESAGLAESALIYKNVGDGINNVEDATESIISTLKAFNIEAQDSMLIVDKFNEIGNNFAISSVGIGEALQKSASALAAAGNSIDESIGLITAANSVVQNPESVGTALKTLSMRLRGTKVELEEAGEDTDGMANSVSSLQKKLEALTHGKVNIMTDANTFKNTAQILEEMAGAWEDMNDVERAAALELMGGKRQANILSAIISNYDIVKDVIEQSTQANGSALKENEKYLDSIQGKLDQFNNAVQTMWANFIDDSVIKNFLSAVTAIIESFTSMGSAATVALGVVVATITSIMTSGIAKWWNMLSSSNPVPLINILSDSFRGVGENIAVATKNLQLFTTTSTGAATLSTGGWLLLIAAIAAIGVAIYKSIKTTEDFIEEWDKAKSEVSKINSELDETRKKIDEINNKNSLSISDREELKRLKQINDQLERRLRLAKASEVNAASSARNSVKKDFNNKFIQGGYIAPATISDDSNRIMEYVLKGIMQAESELVWDQYFTNFGAEMKRLLPQDIFDALSNTAYSKLDAAMREEVNSIYAGYAQLVTDIDSVTFPVGGENYINQLIAKMQELQGFIYDDHGQVKSGLADSYVLSVQEQIDALEVKLSQVAVDLDDYLQQYGEDIDDDFTQRINGLLNTIDQQINPGDYKSKQFDQIMSNYASLQKELYALAQQGQLTTDILNSSEYTPLMNQLYALGLNVQDVVDHINSLSNTSLNKVLDPTFTISEYEDTIDDVQDKISTLKSALSSLSDGSFTSSDFIDLIQKYPELAENVDMLSKNFDGLANNINKKLHKANEDLIEDLTKLRQQLVDNGKDTKQIDALISSLQKLPTDTPIDLRKNFLDLSNAIDKATIAKNKYDKAMESDPQQGYKDRTEAFKDMLERAKRGEIGSMSPIWDAYEYLSGESFDTMQGDLKQKQDRLFEYLTTWKKMYKVDSDGNLTRTSVDSWVKYAQKKIKGATGENGTLAGVEFGFKNGKLDVNLPHDKYEEFAKTVGMSEDALRDFMEALGLYYDLNLNTPDDIKYELDKVIESDGTAEEKLNNFDQALSTLGISIDQFKGQGLTTDDLIEWHVADSQDDADKLLEILQDYYEQRDALVDKYNKEQEDKKTNPLGLERDTDGNYIKGSLGKDIIGSGFTGYTEGENGTPVFNLKDLTAYLSKNGYAPKEISQIMHTMFGENQNQDVQDFLQQINDVVELLESEDMEQATRKLDELGVSWGMITGAYGFEFEIDETSLDSVLEKLGLIQDIKSSLSEDLGFVFGNTNQSESENSNENANIENTITTTVKADTTQATQAIDDLQDSYDGLLTHMSNNKAIVTLSTQTSGSGLVNGNANINGNAYASGTWGAESSSSSLVGELGQELVVRGNRWFTVGDHGAEFQDIKKGDIIFNHKQTKSLLENGYITGRGKVHVNGNAYAHGTAYSTGSGKFRKFTASGISGNANKEAKETIDFIAYKLEEIEKYISKATAELELFLDDTTDTVKKALYYEELVSKEREKQQTQSGAAQIYQLKAEEALKKIPDEFKELAQNGGLEITDFLTSKDAKIAEKIEAYREWAQKAADAEVAELEAIVQISTYRVDQLNDIADDFENIVGILNKQSEIIKSGMDLVSESGQRLSNTYYEEMIASSEQVLVDLDKKREELTSILDKAVKAGDVIVGTDDWFTMANAITDVDAEIVQCATDIESFKNAIKDLHWENFGKLITEIDNVNDQLSGLYDLISDDNDVVDDLGNWTKEGYTSMALLSQQMEAAQYKTRLYEQQIAKLKEDFSKQVYSVDEYNEKMAELIGSQQDSVKAYKDAQEAIVSLNKVRVEAIKDGIQKEIDAYKELIDAKTKSLDKDKEAHEFEKDITDKQKNIATLEKQLAAMVNDNSAATVAKRKKLQADLKAAQEELDETYYEHSVDQQKQALEDEYDNFEKAKKEYMDSLDESLKDVEKVVTDSVENVKLNTESVVKELTELTATYGLEIAQAISAPWQNGATALSDYMGQFSSNTSGFIDQLNNIKTAQEQIAESAETVAIRIINAVKKAQDELNGMSYELTINQSSNSSGYHSNSTVGSGITDHYAKGTLGTSKSGWALIDELGEELVLNAGPDGRLQYLTKGTSVIPADLTNKLMGLALDPSSTLEASRPIISAPELVNNNITIDMNIAEVVHIDSVSNDTIPNLTKAIETQMDSYMKKLNNRLYCKVR